MKRIVIGIFVTLLACMSVDMGAAETQQRLLVVNSRAAYPYTYLGEFREKYLASHGYVAGENLDITYHGCGNDISEGERILRQELPKEYDVICVVGTIATTAAYNVAFGNDSQKFVFASVTDPVGVGVIDDFESPPKANFTGVSHPVPVKSRLTFIRQLLPQAKAAALIYSDSPQSKTYRTWIEDLLAKDPAFQDFTVHFKEIAFPKGEGVSYDEMFKAVEEAVKEFDSKVDVFISPNDPLGDQARFAQTVERAATKPLCGLSREDVMDKRGAAFVIYPSYESMGVQAGAMIQKLFDGKPIKEIIPEGPQNNGIALDLTKTQAFGIRIPVDFIEMAGTDIIK